MCLELIAVLIGRIRIGIPWVSMGIRIRIQQNDADFTGSGSTTLLACMTTIHKTKM
jgi:hypothetical protein